MILQVASQNAHKVMELEKILKIKLLKAPNDFDCIEDGLSLADNSLIKARALYKINKIPTIADDSGLFVRALNWTPGIYSARFGSDIFNRELTQKEKNDLLLEKLKNESDRYAEFRCTLTYLEDENSYIQFTAFLKGEIDKSETGKGGFGYDPIFLVDTKISLASISEDEKNKISHRAKAAAMLRKYLKKEN